MHYMRWQTHGDPGKAGRFTRAPDGTGYVTRDGYRQVSDDEFGSILEHRLVMSRFLGRRLERHERVHHKYGDTLDNRIEHLELWITSHPSGQRVQDQVRWAAMILAKYGAVARRLSALQDPGHEQLILP